MSSREEPLPQLDIAFVDGRIHLSGELDLSNVDRLRSALAERLANNGDVILDLSGLSFIDSTGLQTIVATVSGMDSGSVILRHPTQMVRKLLRITGVDHMPGIRIEADGEGGEPSEKSRSYTGKKTPT